MEATIMMSPAPEILYSLPGEYIMPEQKVYGACGTMMASFIPHSESMLADHTSAENHR